MADNDKEQLVVLLEARIREFEKNFEKANKTATRRWSAIEARGRRAARRIQADMDSVAASFIKSMGRSAVGALGAGGLLTAIVSVNRDLVKMGELARAAGGSVNDLFHARYAFERDGVSADDFNAGVRGMVGLLGEAQREINTLSRLFAANGLSIRDSNERLIDQNKLLENAATLISRARTGADKIKIANMLGLPESMIKTLERGPEHLRAMMTEAGELNTDFEALVKRAEQFDREWQRAWTSFRAFAYNAIFETDGLLSRMGKNAVDYWQTFLSKVLPEDVRKRMGDIEAQLRRPDGASTAITVNAKPSGPPTNIPTQGEGDSFDKALAAAQKRIAIVEAETNSIGQLSEARERARLVAELEAAAIKRNTEAGLQNVAVTDAQRQKINLLADSMFAAAKRQREAREQFHSFNETLQFGGNLAVDVFDKLTSGAENFADTMKSVTAAIKRAVIEAVLLGGGPLAGLLGTRSSIPGATGGLIGAAGSLFSPTPRATGGPVVAGRAYLVGERRPEIFVPNMAGNIIPNTGASGRTSMNVTHNVHNYAPVQVETRSSDDGMTTDTFIRPLEDLMASRMRSGKGSISKVMQAQRAGSGLRG